MHLHQHICLSIVALSDAVKAHGLMGTLQLLGPQPTWPDLGCCYCVMGKNHGHSKLCKDLHAHMNLLVTYVLLC